MADMDLYSDDDSCNINNSVNTTDDTLVVLFSLQ